jgi:glycosyltransferase involved in cell wall biosynthesis
MLAPARFDHYSSSHMSEVRPLILIPSYNTGPILRETVQAVLRYDFPVWVVIDGSTDDSPKLIKGFESAENPSFRIISLEQNSGKGSAVLHGLKLAIEQGFTHILAMDADGQHPAAFIPAFMKLSADHPKAAIFGRPIFDAAAPAIRVSGRKISNFWANLETLGWGIDDSLFGMRLYPAKDLFAVLTSTRFARRFDFDPEAAVRLAWRGVPIINLPTPVRYPAKEEGGISQFRYLRDNILLTSMHFRLLCGFLLRFPKLLLREENPLEHLNPPSA